MSMCVSDLDVHMLRGVMLLYSHSLPYSVIKLFMLIRQDKHDELQGRHGGGVFLFSIN